MEDYELELEVTLKGRLRARVRADSLQQCQERVERFLGSVAPFAPRDWAGEPGGEVFSPELFGVAFEPGEACLERVDGVRAQGKCLCEAHRLPHGHCAQCKAVLVRLETRDGVCAACAARNQSSAEPSASAPPLDAPNPWLLDTPLSWWAHMSGHAFDAWIRALVPPSKKRGDNR